MNANKPLLMFHLITLCSMVLLTSCNNFDDNPKDWTENVIVIVSAKKTDFYPFEGPYIPSEGIIIKEDNSKNGWFPFPLTGINGFSYEEGYTYRLKVKKTQLANSPADGFTFTYALVEIISKEKD